MNAAAIALNRFGLGARPEDAVPAEPRGWLLSQFQRYAAVSPGWAAQQNAPALLALYRERQSAVDKAGADRRPMAIKALEDAVRSVYVAAVAARVGVAMDTPAPFVERLVHFWANHFALSADKARFVAILTGAFEAEAIRPHVLARFEDLLLAVVRHPAMLAYLDQTRSIGPNSQLGERTAQGKPSQRRGLNENLAREIMELHTLGVRSGYTQADVTELARALTGWGTEGPPVNGAEKPMDEGDGFTFRLTQHEPGARKLLGKSYPEGGQAQAEAILKDLAAAPATARHIATKLARHFVADQPPPALVDRLTDTFLRSGGDLPAVYRALIASPEAWGAEARKFKTPWEWGVSSLRALNARELGGPQLVSLMQQLGQPVWRPGSPAGYEDIAANWAAPDALLRRVEVAQRFAAQADVGIDARNLGPRVLPGALSEATAQAVAGSESPASGLALLLVSPEFLRR